MSTLLRREIDKVHAMLLKLCAMAEKHVVMATRAIEEMDKEIALMVINSDNEIDLQEIEIEEESLKILALHQPVAIDLRMIVATVKMNNDLERIGDYACYICKRAIELADMGAMPSQFKLSPMSSAVVSQLKKSVDCLVDLDAELAHEVIRGDRSVDAIQRQIAAWAEEEATHDPSKLAQMVRIVGVIRSLERIADHAVNIAEDVIYMVSGEIVRHPLVRSSETYAAGGQ